MDFTIVTPKMLKTISKTNIDTMECFASLNAIERLQVVPSGALIKFYGDDQEKTHSARKLIEPNKHVPEVVVSIKRKY